MCRTMTKRGSFLYEFNFANFYFPPPVSSKFNFHPILLSLDSRVILSFHVGEIPPLGISALT